MFKIIKKESLSSTNSYALEQISNNNIKSPSIIYAQNQTQGRGQATNSWYSEREKSLTLSVILFPQNIPAERQFILSQIICLALYQTLTKYTDETQIKWPNDIYIGEKKICGILIENALMGNRFAYSICGIGLNINNIIFPKTFSATSLKLATKKMYKLNEIFDELQLHISHYYSLAEQQQWDTINDLYHQYLYKKDKWCNFKEKNTIYKGMIVGVNNYGQLKVRQESGELKTYGFKEVAILPDLL